MSHTLKPRFKIEVGSLTFESVISREFLGLYSHLDMDIPIDVCKIVFTLDGIKELKVGDDVRVYLGYEDDLKVIFTGFLSSIKRGSSSARLECFNSSIKLVKHRVSRVYESQTSGDIVRDLAGEADVQVGEISSGIRLPYYVVDNRRTVYDHMSYLADRNGFELYVNEENKLFFKEYEEKEPHKVEYKVNLLDSDVSVLEKGEVRIVVCGESPASFRGSDTFHWLTKREVKGSAGSGTTIVIFDPVVRDEETADRVAKAKLERMSVKAKGWVRIIGDSTIKLNDTVEIIGVGEEIDGKYQVRGVKHSFSRSRGFTSSLKLMRCVS